MELNLELEKAVKEIKDAKTVLVQLPDGLKPKADEIQSYLEKHTNAKILIWAGSNFGACDIPNIESDIILHFGHANIN